MTIRRNLATVAMVTALLASVAAPAAANAASKNWGPLNVIVNHNISGIGKGTASTTSTSLKNVSRTTGSPTHNVRTETEFYFYEETRDADGTRHMEWKLNARKDGPTTQSTSKATTYTGAVNLKQSASQGRANPRVCDTKPWGTPVPCSSTAINTFSY